MQKLVSKFIRLLYKTALQPNKGKLAYQPIFEQLYKISVEGMNYNNSNIADNGEIYCLDYLASALENEENLVVLDVGANIGDYTRTLLKKFTQPNLNIFSFEPSAETYKKFKENISDNRVTAYNFGFGDKSETLKLYKTEKSSGLSSLYQRNLEHFNITMDDYEEIELKTIDEFCKEHQIVTIDFLKMDVEGHERKVLKGATQMLASDKIKFIQFEFGGCNIDSRTYFQDFYYTLKDKYVLYRIMKDGLYPIHQYREVYEIFNTVNFLAKHKSLTY